MRAAIVLLALGIAGCSADPPAAGSTTNNAYSDPTPQPRSRPAGSTAGLHADVSDLGGDVSGLSTRVTETATIIDLPTDTLFAFDKSDLDPAASANLAKVAEAIRQGAPGPITIIGHSDAKGEDAYNLRLSKARADAVADWMRDQVGVRHRTFVVEGKGEKTPIAPNTTPDGSDDPKGRARNRRVEITIPRAI